MQNGTANSHAKLPELNVCTYVELISRRILANIGAEKLHASSTVTHNLTVHAHTHTGPAIVAAMPKFCAAFLISEQVLSNRNYARGTPRPGAAAGGLPQLGGFPVAVVVVIVVVFI